jgi:superfamily I DNA and/or RNA helicase
MLSFFSLVRDNRERNVGSAGTLQDLNVAISRSKEILINYYWQFRDDD